MYIFIFALGFVLILLNFKVLLKEKNSFQDLLKLREEYIYPDTELIALRKDLGESITELQLEIESIKEELTILKEEYNSYKEEILLLKEELLDFKSLKNTSGKGKPRIRKKVIDEKMIHLNPKTQKIKELLEEGREIDEICELLALGKGEVLLVKELYLQ